MNIIHVSDLHLGKSIHGVSMVENGDQTVWVDRFLATVKDISPQAVVIAGDVYDRSAPAEDAVDRLPWIVIQFAPVKNVTVKATNLTTGYVAPEITFPAYFGEEDGYTLLTLCGKELGLVDTEGKSDAEAMKGEWLVELNDYSTFVTIQ
jgi:hypothetical protein